ncbi:DNA-binding protein [Halomonas pacifica]|uniref:DNA-binding protein n=1 Tax=Bisbaumannia pacifica TaxID=77098 RepID=UPI00235926EA|nr:DNA-binding protein [Halomonas pacifica]MDC8804848.1 DNA-binding protein [Halomonas pacifica]
MARSGVQYEDVQRAIDTLLQRQETPSVQKVREVLGTGSFTTISDHLREWRARRESNRDTPPTQALPEALQRGMAELWTEAQERANQALGHYREEADRRVAEAQEAADQARRQAEDAAQRESALAEQLHRALARLEALGALASRLEAERDQAREAEQRLGKEQEEWKAEVTRLRGELEAREAAHQQALAEQVAAHRQQLAQEEQRHEAAESRLMALLDEARQQRQADDKQHRERHQRLEARLSRLDSQLEEQRRLTAEAEKARQEAQQQADRSGQLRQAEAQARHDGEARLEALLAARESENAALKGQLEALQGQLAALQARLAEGSLPPFVY